MRGVCSTRGASGGIGGAKLGLAVDWMLPWVFYGLSETNQLIVVSALHAIFAPVDDNVLNKAMIVENFDFGGGGVNFIGSSSRGDLNMFFQIFGAGEEISLFDAVWEMLFARMNAIYNWAKMLAWKTPDDPLVLDLDGDGIETSSFQKGGVHFDMDADGFAELTGWVGADDGLEAANDNTKVRRAAA